MVDEKDITTDRFFDGCVTIYQKTRGYRFSIDAVLLAALPQPKPGDLVMDIGTGCGIVAILMAYRNPDIRLIGIEVQDGLANVAQRNVKANHMQDQVTIFKHDVRSFDNDMFGSVDWIVSNPPYYSTQSGRINPTAERALARHEININLHELIQTSRKFLKTGGRFAIIFPGDRLVELFYEMRAAGLEPKWMQSIHSRNGEAAKLILVQGLMRGNPGLKIADPLTIYSADGNYTHAVRQIMAP